MELREEDMEKVKGLVEQSINKLHFSNQILLSNCTLDLVNDSFSSYMEDDSFQVNKKNQSHLSSGNSSIRANEAPN